MGKKFWACVLVACFMLAAGAFADDFQVVATGPGASFTATLTATPTGTPGQDLVTAITGEYNGEPLGTLFPGGPTPSTSPANVWLFNNVLYTSAPYLDPYGLGFYLNGGLEANLFYVPGTGPGTGYQMGTGNSLSDINVVSFDHFTVSTPEPSSVALLAGGILALAGITRKRVRK